MKRRPSCVLIALMLVLALVLPTPAGAATLDVESDTVTTLSVSSDTVSTVRADWITNIELILGLLEEVVAFFTADEYSTDDLYEVLTDIDSRLSPTYGTEMSDGTKYTGNIAYWVAHIGMFLLYDNGTTYTAADLLAEIWKDTNYLYYIYQDTSYLDDTYQYNGSSIHLVAILGNILDLADEISDALSGTYSWTSNNGTTFGGNLLYWIYRTGRSSLYGTDSATYYTAQLLYYIWQDTDYLEYLDVLDDTLSYEWSDGTTWSGNFLFWIYRTSQNLAFSPSSSDSIYSAAQLLYYIWLDTDYLEYLDVLDDTLSYEWSDGTTWSGNFLFWIYRTSQNLAFSPSSSDSIYSAAQLLYYIWLDSSSILDAINELALAIDFDALLEALEDISDAISDNGSDLIDAVESLGDAFDDVSELLEDGFDNVSDGFEDVSESLETLTSDSSSIVDSLTSLTDSIDDMSDTLDDISDSVGASDSGLDLWDLIIGAIDTVTLADDLQDLAESVEDTFPLGIVFWVPDFLFVFIADPVAPCFEFDLSAIGGGTIVMDLSMFDDIAVLVRGCVLICYILGLYFSTKKFIFVADDSDG